MGHFGDVQEVAGIPIGEIGGGVQFAQGTLQVAIVSLQAIKQGKYINALQAGATLAQQAGTDDFVLDRGSIHDFAGFGFQLIEEILGGGMGVAPLISLVDTLKSENVKTIYTLIGGKTKNSLLCVKDFKKLTAQVLLATDDGSCGEKGLVSDTLSNMLDKIQGTIYACGPRAMLKAVAKISAKNKLNCQVLMEARMACGIGTCLGCVIKTKAGYKKVCDDGPVFDSKEIIWQS